MSIPRVTHPTGRPNYSEVETGNGLTYAFSYATCVGFMGPRGRLTRENDWGPTTGRHLNYWDGGSPEAKAQRIPGALFERLLADAEQTASEEAKG